MLCAHRLTQGRQLGAQRLWPPFRLDLPEPCYPTPTSPAPPPQISGSAKAPPACSPPHAAAAAPNGDGNTEKVRRRKRRGIKAECRCEHNDRIDTILLRLLLLTDLMYERAPLHEVPDVPSREKTAHETHQPRINAIE